MANKVQIVQNIAGSITKSNLAKVGLGESVNMFVERQQNSDEKSTSILMRTIQGEVLAQNIQGKCRGMYRVSRGYDNKPVLYAVYDTTLYLIDSNNNAISIGTINSYTTGASSQSLENLLRMNMPKRVKGKFEHGEIGLPMYRCFLYILSISI